MNMTSKTSPGDLHYLARSANAPVAAHQAHHGPPTLLVLLSLRIVGILLCKANLLMSRSGGYYHLTAVPTLKMLLINLFLNSRPTSPSSRSTSSRTPDPPRPPLAPDRRQPPLQDEPHYVQERRLLLPRRSANVQNAAQRPHLGSPTLLALLPL
jgi:hypothetical protein